MFSRFYMIAEDPNQVGMLQCLLSPLSHLPALISSFHTPDYDSGEKILKGSVRAHKYYTVNVHKGTK